MQKFDPTWKLSRRDFVKFSSAVSIALAGQGCSLNVADKRTAANNAFKDISIYAPCEVDSIKVFTDEREIDLNPGHENCWGSDKIEVRITESDLAANVFLKSPEINIQRIRIRYNVVATDGALYLGDHWERGYGDLQWMCRDDQRVIPWYFLSYDGKVTDGWGVKTGSGAMCFWQRDGGGINLWLDVRNGTKGVSLSGRELLCCKVVHRKGTTEESPFSAAREFCKNLCDAPRISPFRIYGGNDWYYSYGENCAEKILRDADFISAMADGINNRPFTVIDAGWQYFRSNCGGGPWHSGNKYFGDMAELAAGIKKRQCMAGIWYRPLSTTEKLPSKYYFAERDFTGLCPGDIMDPSRDLVLEKVYADARRFNEWGYELIKHDFSTYDIFGRWGSEMGYDITAGQWGFADESKTSAEIIINFYQTIRSGAGESLVVGCNTIGHLGAGIFDIQRTGDDNGANEWDRTRRMAINTLGFRMSQHETFFTVDPDCVAITKEAIWPMSSQLLDLFSKSGTVLFISADPDKMNKEQKAAIKTAFENINRIDDLAEPLDWLGTTCPRSWKIAGEKVKYNWYDKEGVNPFKV